jgi:hypothetical protein
VSNLRYYVSRARRKIDEAWFAKLARRVLDFRPLEMREAPLRFVSMVSHSDLCPWICAIRSVYAQVGEGTILVLDDGSLTQDDHAIIRRLVPLSRIEPISTVALGSCPRGGTWERLARIVELTSEAYVIQVDADTLALEAIPEVVESYRQNRSFILGTTSGIVLEPVRDVAAKARTYLSSHVQCAAEMAMEHLPGADKLYYVRGSSGFAGFGRGLFDRNRLDSYSAAMRAMLGPRWDEWGTEQVSSNFIIANSAGAHVLPIHRYVCFSPSIDMSQAVFVHFFGTHRYELGVYANSVRHFLSREAS